MKKLIMTKGLPASGKSTWAKEWVKNQPKGAAVRVNRDDLREMLNDYNFCKSVETVVTNIETAAINAAMLEGKHVVVDATNLDPQREELFRKIAKRNRAEFSIQDFTHVPLTECIKRNEKREGRHRVSEQVIRRMNRQYLAPTKPEFTPMERIKGLPSAIICDLDGTLAHMTDRTPYEGHKCASDEVDPVVFDILNRFDQTHHIIFMSGRAKDNGAEEATRKWIEEHTGYFTDGHHANLFMREAKDYRKDSIVKEELFNKHVRGKYNVDFCLDDRDQVVEQWRKMGLKCLQVADGNF